MNNSHLQIVSALRDMAPNKPVKIPQAVAARGVNDHRRLWLLSRRQAWNSSNMICVAGRPHQSMKGGQEALIQE